MRHDVAESTYLDLAANAPGYPVGPFPDFQPVAAIGTSGPSDRFKVTGSATLIAPSWVLTAAHLVLSAKQGRDFETGIEVRFGPTASSSQSRNKVIRAVTPVPPAQLRPLVSSGPGFTEGQIVHAEFHDLALLELDAPVGGIAPAAVDDLGESLLGRPIFIAGFGEAARGDNPRSRSWIPADAKRAAQNIVDREILRNPYGAASSGGLILFDFDNGTSERNTLNMVTKPWDKLFGPGESSAQPTRFEGAPYPGDSGGPAFSFAGSQWRIVAVSGYGTGFPPGQRRPSIQYGDILVYTRISPHAEWIRRTLAERR